MYSNSLQLPIADGIIKIFVFIITDSHKSALNNMAVFFPGCYARKHACRRNTTSSFDFGLHFGADYW